MRETQALPTPLDIDLQTDPYTHRGPDSTLLVHPSWSEGCCSHRNTQESCTYIYCQSITKPEVQVVTKVQLLNCRCWLQTLTKFGLHSDQVPVVVLPRNSWHDEGVDPGGEGSRTHKAEAQREHSNHGGNDATKPKSKHLHDKNSRRTEAYHDNHLEQPVDYNNTL